MAQSLHDRQIFELGKSLLHGCGWAHCSVFFVTILIGRHITSLMRGATSVFHTPDTGLKLYPETPHYHLQSIPYDLEHRRGAERDCRWIVIMSEFYRQPVSQPTLIDVSASLRFVRAP